LMLLTLFNCLYFLPSTLSYYTIHYSACILSVYGYRSSSPDYGCLHTTLPHPIYRLDLPLPSLRLFPTSWLLYCALVYGVNYAATADHLGLSGLPLFAVGCSFTGLRYHSWLDAAALRAAAGGGCLRLFRTEGAGFWFAAGCLAFCIWFAFAHSLLPPTTARVSDAHHRTPPRSPPRRFTFHVLLRFAYYIGRRVAKVTRPTELLRL